MISLVSVPTLLVHSLVNVGQDILEMEHFVKVF